MKEGVEKVKAFHFGNTLNLHVVIPSYFVMDNEDKGGDFLYAVYYLDIEHSIDQRVLIKSVVRFAEAFMYGIREHDSDDCFFD